MSLVSYCRYSKSKEWTHLKGQEVIVIKVTYGSEIVLTGPWMGCECDHTIIQGLQFIIGTYISHATCFGAYFCCAVSVKDIE